MKLPCSDKSELVMTDSGAEVHLNWTSEIVKEIAKEKNLHFKMALRFLNQQISVVKEQI